MIANRFTLAALALLAGTTVVSAEQVRGIVTKVDAEASQLTIAARGPGVRGTTMSFPVAKDAQIYFLGGRTATLKEVPVGKPVQVSLETQDGKKVAVVVRVTAIKPAGMAAAPSASDPNALTGKLRRVAFTEREIVLAIPGAGDKETYVSLPVADDARITRDDKPIKFDDLKEEETAVVKTEMRKDRKVAVTIQTGKVTMASPDEASRVARLREILKMVEGLLELAEKLEKK